MRRYKKEVLRLLAEVSLGTGALAVIGGTVGVIAFLAFFTGTEVGLQGYSALNQLGTVGVHRLRLGVLQHPRDRAAGRRRSRSPPPSAAASPRSSARCGSPRRSTRSRSMGVPSLPFLVTTRMIAGFVAVIPLYVLGLLVLLRRDPR